MEMYTKEGQEVRMIKKIEDGYLAKEIYGWSDEEGEEIESEQTVFYSELFEKPLIKKYSDEVTKLKQTTKDLNDEIHQLIRKRDSDEHLLNKVSKLPIVQQLVDYINGDFEFVVLLRDLNIKDKNSIYKSPYVTMSHLKKGGYHLSFISSDYYTSHLDDRKFLCFKTKKEAEEYSRNQLLERINNFDSNYNKSHNLKCLLQNINSSCKSKSDKGVLEIFYTKMALLLKQEKVEKQQKLDEQIEELKKKQKAIEESV